jgi:short-subunit dehydrogenase
MEVQLRGRKALVTGASQGIGLSSERIEKFSKAAIIRRGNNG